MFYIRSGHLDSKHIGSAEAYSVLYTLRASR